MNEKIKLNKEKKDHMIQAIKTFFLEKRDQDIGELAATLILNFFLEELAPEVYNQGVFDAHQYMKDRIDDIFEIQIY